MNESLPTQVDLWQRRWLHLRSAVQRANFRRIFPFASGMIATFVALLLYNWFFPHRRR